jgi:putative transferase (TIGR04331 family)
MRRVLITTAIEETWPAADVPVLFLGEWCKLHSRKAAWEKRDAITLDYHWEDRDKLYKDYVYLQNLYEDLLEETANNLNKLHGTCHSKKYWRILVGPWLNYFIHILYDRWSCIGRALQFNDELVAKTIEYRVDDLVPNDMEHFTKLMVSDDWNEKIYAELLVWSKLPIEKCVKLNNRSLINDGAVLRRHTIGLALRRILNRISSVFCGETSYFLKSSYIPLWEKILIQIKLGQIPFLWFSSTLPRQEFSAAMRQWSIPDSKGFDDFLSIVRIMIFRQIPIIYVEGYAKLNNIAASGGWPTKPRLVFTDNSHISDDFFKSCVAKYVEIGCPLVIGQHGGGYGIMKWACNEEHEKNITDGYLTWGWTDIYSSNIRPLGVNQFNRKDFRRAKSWDGLLLIEQSLPRYSYKSAAEPISTSFLKYIEEQFRFVDSLPPEIIKKTIVRLHRNDYGWSHRMRWQEKFPNLCIDDSSSDLIMKMYGSKIVVSTYNGTSFLQSISLNIPTVIFWNPQQWELRDAAIPAFKALESAGIFHKTPEDAARHIASVWQNLGQWWNSSDVQLARQTFCRNYVHIPDNFNSEISKYFKKIADTPPNRLY